MIIKPRQVANDTFFVQKRCPLFAEVIKSAKNSFMLFVRAQDHTEVTKGKMICDRCFCPTLLWQE